MAESVVNNKKIAKKESVQRIQILSNTNWVETYGKRENISDIVKFLCKKEASFITGQNITADGEGSLGFKEV